MDCTWIFCLTFGTPNNDWWYQPFLQLDDATELNYGAIKFCSRRRLGKSLDYG